MDIEVSITIDKDIYDIFQIILKRSNQDQKDIIESLFISYASNQMEKEKKTKANELPTIRSFQTTTVSYGKANDKIPIWAHKPHQYNHKIIRSYFTLLNNSSEVTLNNMELLCSDEKKPALYVPTFKTNYASMKFDSEKSHGKVFVDDGKYVSIWPEVKETLLRYKKYFE